MCYLILTCYLISAFPEFNNSAVIFPYNSSLFAVFMTFPAFFENQRKHAFIKGNYQEKKMQNPGNKITPIDWDFGDFVILYNKLHVTRIWSCYLIQPPKCVILYKGGGVGTHGFCVDIH